MISLHRSPSIVLLIIVVAAGIEATSASAQQAPAAHYRWPSQTPLGQVGSERLTQGGPVVGYFQPVVFSSSQEITISVARDGDWTDATTQPVYAGLLLGQTYRLKLSHLPLHPDRECYPTVEVIDRTYPPPGVERRFPIPIVFNDDDVRLAVDGKFVTRVVYIEDPQQAIPGGQQPGEQLWHDAGSHANPLEVADRLGRPVAIVRLGGRVPDEKQGPDYAFQFGCPKWLLLIPPTSASAVVTAPKVIPTPRTRRPTPPAETN
jgi:hypothetical protein